MIRRSFVEPGLGTGAARSSDADMIERGRNINLMKMGGRVCVHLLYAVTLIHPGTGPPANKKPQGEGG